MIRILFASLLFTSVTASADKVYHCDIPGGESRVVLRSQSPDHFPQDYVSVSVQQLQNGNVISESHPFRLEVLHDGQKSAVFRFQIKSGDPDVRSGILAWNPGDDAFYVSAPGSLTWAGSDICSASR